LNKIFSHNKELENEYNIVMKSMVVGAYEALDKLSGGMSNLNETGQQVNKSYILVHQEQENPMRLKS
jgi:hypothetical protein